MAHKPKFPFRIVTAWTPPSEIRMGEGCQTPGPTYATDNYIDMQRMIGKDMYVTLVNDPWVRAIKAQAREQYEVSLTSDTSQRLEAAQLLTLYRSRSSEKCSVAATR